VYAKRNFDEVVLYFENEEEKLSFESYVERNLTKLETNITDAEQVHFTVDIGDERETKVNIHRLSVGLALNVVLQDFKKL
jgi:ribosome-associated translation inhibitor RaiA